MTKRLLVKTNAIVSSNHFPRILRLKDVFKMNKYFVYFSLQFNPDVQGSIPGIAPDQVQVDEERRRGGGDADFIDQRRRRPYRLLRPSRT